MSKLDDIFNDDNNRIPYEGVDEEIVKRKIKGLFSELTHDLGHTSDNEDDLLDRLREKIKEL
jgi:hypothetical protein